MNKSRINLLPGPVEVKANVHQAFKDSVVSHRSEEFIRDFFLLKDKLTGIVESRFAQIFMGSGTMANDVVAAQLKQIPGTGLIISNGEFGERLIDHAKSANIDFDQIIFGWGDYFDYAHIERFLALKSAPSWIWAVNCETSTGVLNNINDLITLSEKYKSKLILDCISSIGNIPLDLSRVYLASGVSGKGFASYSGLSMVFHNHEVTLNQDEIPRYLNLGLYAKAGIPFTLSSNLIYALNAALDNYSSFPLFEIKRQNMMFVRNKLEELGFEIISDMKNSSVGVVTVKLPKEINSRYVGDNLRELGFETSYASEYLLTKNWLQICTMGEVDLKEVSSVVDMLDSICTKSKSLIS